MSRDAGCVFDLASTPIEEGVTVVEASAGTGKTYCLTGLVLRMLLERRVGDVGKVLVVTFTNAATDELTTRLRASLRAAYRLFRGELPPEDADPFLRHLAERHGGDEGRRILRRALLHFDDLGVFTIHGFCKRVLEESAFESGIPFQPEFLDNDEPVLRRATQDFWRRHLYRASELVTAVAIDRGWTPESFLDDYRAWRRHPGTRVLPPPPALDAAVAEVEAAVAELDRGFDHAGLRTFLTGLRFLKTARLDPDRLHLHLDALDGLCRRRDSAGLATARLLTPEGIEKSVFKKELDRCRRHPVVRACGRLEAAVGELEHALRGRFLVEVDELFEEAKRRAGALAFDDLLRRVLRALQDDVRGTALAAVVRGQFQAALIDEFQDTDLVQYEIFRRLFAGGPLYLIGDPKQAIYRFRGADVFAYMAARADADRRYTLDRNWRSAPELIDALGGLFERAPRPFVFPRIPYERVTAAEVGRERLAGDGGRPVEWLWLPREQNKDQAARRIRRAVVAEVVRLLEGGARLGDRPLRPADVAVLVRTNDQAAAFQDAFRRARVPSVLSRAGDVFHSEEMAELHRLLAALVDPGDVGRLRGAWATRLWGDDAAAIRSLNEDDEAWQERLEELAEHRRRWRRQGFMPMIHRLLAGRDVRRRLLAREEGERRLTNLLHAVEVLQQAIHERHLSPTGLLAWLAAERAPDRVHDAEAAELRLESDERAVQIATVHKSKGLEYEVVFCPFLWDARTENRAPALVHTDPREVVYDFGSPELDRHLALAEAERLAEELRLAYVAVTRARHRCYLVWGDLGRDAAAVSPLGYLLRPGVDGGAVDADGDSGDVGGWVRSALERLRKSRAGWRRSLEELVARNPEGMGLRVVDEEPEEAVWRGAGEPPRTLNRRTPPAGLEERLVPWRMVSFTSLARGRESEEPDHLDPETPLPLRPLPAAPTSPHGLFAFARGARAGTCLHEILESCDLGDVDGEATVELVAATLRRHGLEHPDRHADGDPPAGWNPAAVVRTMLRRLSAAPLPGAGFALGEVAREEQIPEWHFYAPLEGAAPSRLAGVFRRHGKGRVRDDYAPRLEALDRRAVRGFLTGFVDLVFTHRERWYLVDWKSNHLGDRPSEYGREGMWQAMSHHHYLLQYHLYLLALHRYLRHRLPGYDYDRHFGGVYYVFLRGVTGDGDEPGNGEGSAETPGWYVDRPPRVLIEGLESFLEGGGG